LENDNFVNVFKTVRQLLISDIETRRN